MTRDYTRKKNGKVGASEKGTIDLGAATPDNTIHHPPVILFLLGGGGFLAGIIANCWQVFTTFMALWVMFNVGSYVVGGPLNFWQKQPAIAAICALIACCAQYFLQLLVFRLEKTWKQEQAEGKTTGGAMLGSAVRLVQQTDLVLIISVLAFVVDTVGDFTFVSVYTSSPFLIFAYAVALYAFSTLGFVRSIEYLWAGWSAMYGTPVKKGN